MTQHRYESPLVSRYASDQMARLWSAHHRAVLWRRLWVALAEAQAELGLPISQEQLQELREHVEDVDLQRVAQYERRFRHDVMAHVHAYADQCPKARGIIHLGATSCYVTDNADLLVIREALQLVRRRLVGVLAALAQQAQRYRDLPCLAYTHFQTAQPTTVGKRLCLWAYDLLLDFEELEHRLKNLRLRGVKGTTGTQASFLQLFDGDHQKVLELERRVAAKLGFEHTYPITGQTYPRKVDMQVLDLLAQIAASAHKAATDLRLLQHHHELEEPFEREQIGSSAMAYKRNPMRAERICALARVVLSLQSSPAMTHSVQWLERTLDDSANRRVVLPEAFLATDGLLILYRNVVSGLVVYPQVIRRRLEQELPFLATERILMEAVRRGGDRQRLHERIRQHSQAAAQAIKEHGQPNDLIQRLQADPEFAQVPWEQVLDAESYIGRAPQQVDEFLQQHLQPLLDRFPQAQQEDAQVEV